MTVTETWVRSGATKTGLARIAERQSGRAHLRAPDNAPRRRGRESSFRRSSTSLKSLTLRPLLLDGCVCRPIDTDFPDSERKIDQIESRLGNIEHLLKNLSSNNTSPNPHATTLAFTPGTGSSVAPTAASVNDFDSSDEDSAFGGDAGFTSQSALASEFLENAVQRTSLREVNPGIEAALSNLRSLVEVQKQRSISHGPRFPLQKPLPPGGLAKMPMPPMEAVVPILKANKSITPPLLLCWRPRC